MGTVILCKSGMRFQSLDCRYRETRSALAWGHARSMFRRPRTRARAPALIEPQHMPVIQDSDRSLVGRVLQRVHRLVALHHRHRLRAQGRPSRFSSSIRRGMSAQVLDSTSDFIACGYVSAYSIESQPPQEWPSRCTGPSPSDWRTSPLPQRNARWSTMRDLSADPTHRSRAGHR